MTLAEIGVNNLAVFPQLGLIVFFVIFIAVAIRAIRRPRSEMTDCANIPLDEAPANQRHTSNNGDAK